MVVPSLGLAVPMPGTVAVPMPGGSEAGGQATPSINISKGQPSTRGLLACPPPSGAVPLDHHPTNPGKVNKYLYFVISNCLLLLEDSV